MLIPNLKSDFQKNPKKPKTQKQDFCSKSNKKFF